MNAKKGMIPPTLNAKVGHFHREGVMVLFPVAHSWASLAEFIAAPDELYYNKEHVIVTIWDMQRPHTPQFFKQLFSSPILESQIDMLSVCVETGEITVRCTSSLGSAIATEVIRILTEYYEEMKRESRVVTISADEVHGKSREPCKGGIWGK